MWNKKEMSQLDATLTRVPLTLIFDLENSRSNCTSGMGGSIVMERKRQESLGCPDVKHNHYVTPRQRILLPTGWLKMSAFPSTRLVNTGASAWLPQCHRDIRERYWYEWLIPNHNKPQQSTICVRDSWTVLYVSLHVFSLVLSMVGIDKSATMTIPGAAYICLCSSGLLHWH